MFYSAGQLFQLTDEAKLPEVAEEPLKVSLVLNHIFGSKLE